MIFVQNLVDVFNKILNLNLCRFFLKQIVDLFGDFLIERGISRPLENFLGMGLHLPAIELLHNKGKIY